MKTNFGRLSLFWILLGLTPQVRAQTDSNIVVVAFATSTSTPLNAGFAGFPTEVLGTGVKYGDTNLQRVASALSPGWLLFPGGSTSDAFDWSSGLTVQSWINEIGANGNAVVSNLCQVTYNALLGKGGAKFSDFAGLAAGLGGAKIIVCINGFTDTAASAGALAQYALSNHIQVAVWELCNEPYLFKGAGNFFANGTDYANKMKPYRDAIKAADSNAVVAVFFSDPALPGTAWDNDLANYTNRYWDAVVYHHYPRLPTNGAFADLMAMDNGILFSTTTSFVTNQLMSQNSSNVTYLITELNPTLGNGDGTQNLPTGTLYGGIFASEYVMRMSTVPQMSFVGSYQLINGSGVDTTNKYWNAVTKAAADGYVTNTIGLPFGYFLSAQASAEAVVYWALNRSTAVYPTTIGANGPTVPMDTNGIGTMPAAYAQAYQGGNGKQYVLLTNKGSNAVPVEITQDGVALTNQLLQSFVTAGDPSLLNTNPPVNNAVLQTSTVANPISIPGYSVVRLEWTVYNGSPGITSQPQGQTVVQDQGATFSVAASGNAPLSYQWYFNSAAVSAATNVTLALVDVQTNQAGNYTVVMTNSSGSITSQVAAPVGEAYVILASTNLQNWTPIYTNVAPLGGLLFTDPAATNLGTRWYRGTVQ